MHAIVISAKFPRGKCIAKLKEKEKEKEDKKKKKRERVIRFAREGYSSYFVCCSFNRLFSTGFQKQLIFSPLNRYCLEVTKSCVSLIDQFFSLVIKTVRNSPHMHAEG